MAPTASQRYASLTDDALAEALRDLPGWSVDAGHLVCRVHPGDPWSLLERVHEVEERLDHHSRVTLDHGDVVFTVWTHVRPHLTAADVELARSIDEAAREGGPGCAQAGWAQVSWAQAGRGPRRTLSPECAGSPSSGSRLTSTSG